MFIDLPGSTAATALDVYVWHRVSVAADFFHAYPRLFNASRDFATTPDYRIGLYKLGIPYMITGLVLLLLSLGFNFYFFSCRGVVPGADDTRESDPHRRDKVGRLFLLFSCFLNLGVILCIAIAFASAFTMRAAANSAHNVLNAAHVNISIHVAAPAQMVQTLAGRVSRVDPNSMNDDVRTAAEDVQLLFKNRETAITTLVDRTRDLFDNLEAINDEVRYLSKRFFRFTFAVLMVCTLGLILTFVCDATLPDSKNVRIAAFALLLVPFAATWAHTAVSTWIAVASGDFCQSIEEYHRVVLTQAGEEALEMSKSNIFAEFKLQCPGRTDYIRDLKEFNLFFGDTAGYEFFNEGFKALIKDEISGEAWANTSKWAQDRIIDYGNCDTQVALAGRLSHYICGDHGLSAVSVIGQLWLCSFGLALLFTVIVGLLTWGHPPSEFIAGRELMYMYGAPKLISAFGDIESALFRHATFRRLEAEMDVGKNLSPTSSDLDVMQDIAQDYRLMEDDDSSTLERKPRRNVYVSHKLKDQKTKLSVWSLDLSHDGDQSTDSSGFS